MNVQIEVSLYPLRRPHIGPEIEAFLSMLDQEGWVVRQGSMGTLLQGEASEIFPAIGAAFAHVADWSEVVLVLKASNACPACEASAGSHDE